MAVKKPKAKKSNARTVRVPVQNLKEIFADIAQHKPIKRDVVCVPVKDIIEVFNVLSAAYGHAKKMESGLKASNEKLTETHKNIKDISDKFSKI